MLRSWSLTDFHRATGTSSLNPKEQPTLPSQNLYEAAGLPQDTDPTGSQPWQPWAGQARVLQGALSDTLDQVSVVGTGNGDGHCE